MSIRPGIPEGGRLRPRRAIRHHALGAAEFFNFFSGCAVISILIIMPSPEQKELLVKDIIEGVNDLESVINYWVNRYGLSPSIVEDIKQNAIIKLLMLAGSSKNTAELSQGLYAVTLRNLCLSEARRASNRYDVCEGDLPEVLSDDKGTTDTYYSQIPDLNAESPEETLIRLDNLSILLEAIGTLFPREQQVIRLKLEELSQEEIANTLGIRLGTVKSAINRAMGKLRKNDDINELYKPR